MLSQLTIKNIAIIDDLTFTLDDGFNVLTGETGAGKSIIVDGIGLLLGNRASSTMIRHGKDRAYVEGVFLLSNKTINNLKEFDIDIEDNTLIISKDLFSDGRSITKVNGRNVSLATLKQISSYIVNIHSQFDNQYLFNASYHSFLVDEYAFEKLELPLKDYQETYKKYKECLRRLDEITSSSLKEDDLEFYQYKLDEINSLDLKEGEIEELDIEKNRISRISKINDRVKEAIALINDEKGALDLLYQAKKSIGSIASDPLFEKYEESLINLYEQMNDTVSELKRDFASMDYDEYRINEIEHRISEVNKIRHKYGSSYEDILMTKEELENNINIITNKVMMVSELEKEISELLVVLCNKAEKLTAIRESEAKKLSDKVKRELEDLYLKNTEIEFKFDKSEEYTNKGNDKIELYISFNKGEALKPLAKVASGGEISRVMLGLKCIFNKLMGIEVTIFDEVDSGISGDVAAAVADKMKILANDMQVIAITHLPVVAARASTHFYISKSSDSTHTFTSLEKLNVNRRIEVIASMIAGKDSKGAIISAKELLNV